ncbi:MAG TPA: hypothetical protein VK363_19305 [Pyrinomonadaceae bacterium]|nr:hypothetical protein [Pyrinomonadaceae bacterium]
MALGLAAPTFFRCPKCSEYISADAASCRFCGAPVDAAEAARSAATQQTVNSAYSDALTLRQLAYGCLVGIGFGLLKFRLVGTIAYLFALTVLPVLIVRWHLRYRKIKSDDPDFKKARSARNFAVAVASVPILLSLVMIVLLLVGVAR